jgi:hypothetical protein
MLNIFYALVEWFNFKDINGKEIKANIDMILNIQNKSSDFIQNMYKYKLIRLNVVKTKVKNDITNNFCRPSHLYNKAKRNST